MERLRYVARASGASQAMLVRESADALVSVAGDRAGLLTACLRILDRQPTSGALVWLSARLLGADSPASAAWELCDEIEADRTPRELAHAFPDEATVCVLGWPELVGQALFRRGDVTSLIVDQLGEAGGLMSRLYEGDGLVVDVAPESLGAAAAGADVVVIEALAVGPDECLAVVGSRAAAAVAADAGVPVWLVAGLGRSMPDRMWAGFRSRLEAQGDADDALTATEEIVPMRLIDQVVGPNGLTAPAEYLGRPDAPAVAELFVR